MTGKRKNYLRHGVGINDANYNTKDCPYMRRWGAMLQRCYSKSYQKRKPTYKGCTVCEEWLTFSNFKKWMETQDWEGKHLDKDFLGNGKLYSPESCCFIDAKINSFLAISTDKRELPIGVSEGKDGYTCQLSNGEGVRQYKGHFKTPELAHRTWQVNKIIIGAQLPLLCGDERILEKLRVVLNNILNDYISGKETHRGSFYE